MTELPENSWKGVSCVNFLEQYEFLQILGQGASGRVYLARHKVLDTLRAIKVLSKSQPQAIDFLKEAQILQNLNHPGIPHIYEVAEDADQYYLIEEYISGTSLQTLISSAPEKIPLTDIIKYGIKLCNILSYLHSQNPYPLLYLDFKPEHVICSGDRLYLLDFGSVRQEREWSAGAGIPGTAGFVSPEVKTGKRPNKRSDIYGVGALLYYMATGSRYEGKSSFKGYGSAADELKTVLKRCLADEMDERYQDMLFLKNDLIKLNNRGRKKGETSSLTVVVAGAIKRLGVTHTAIGLTAWLNRKKLTALYLDETGEHITELLAEESGDAMERQGMIRIGDFLGLPCFGAGVECEIDEFPIHVLDIGSLSDSLEFKERREKQRRLCMEADVILLLLGGREWEINLNRAVLDHWELPQKPVILFPFGVTDSAKRMLRELKIRRYYTVPFFHVIWKTEKQAAEFYQTLWEKIAGKGGID